MIPAFKPVADFSPICWAVRVQTEHCAAMVVRPERQIKKKISNKTYLPALLIILQIYKPLSVKPELPS
jgi:hypothetical protein